MIYIKTKKDILAESLIELTTKNNFDRVTVEQIVNNCTLSRRTFYNHFIDKKNLLEWTLSNDTVIFGQGSAEAGHTLSDTTLRYLKLIKKHKQFYLNILSSQVGEALFRNEMKRRFTAILMNRKTVTMSHYFMVDFISHGFTAAIYNWLQTATKDSPESLLKSLEKCIPEDLFIEHQENTTA